MKRPLGRVGTQVHLHILAEVDTVVDTVVDINAGLRQPQYEVLSACSSMPRGRWAMLAFNIYFNRHMTMRLLQRCNRFPGDASLTDLRQARVQKTNKVQQESKFLFIKSSSRMVMFRGGYYICHVDIYTVTCRSEQASEMTGNRSLTSIPGPFPKTSRHHPSKATPASKIP